jgi:hypothetical protein
MSHFDDVSLEWAGKTYVIKANMRMRAIARIEEHITLAEMQDYWARKTAPMSRLSMAYASLLRFLGADVQDDDVYVGMFPGGSENPARVRDAITLLLAMMVPPKAFKSASPESASSGNVMPATAASSKRHTRSRSARGK